MFSYFMFFDYISCSDFRRVSPEKRYNSSKPKYYKNFNLSSNEFSNYSAKIVSLQKKTHFYFY